MAVHQTDSNQTFNGQTINGLNYGNGTGDKLQQSATSGSVNIPRDVFEQLYLNPQGPIKGELRKTFGNPTPIALAGFVVSAFPLACDLMGWRGAGGLGAANIGAYYFLGGLLQIIGCILEFILGNTFISVVFGVIGGFWLSFGATTQPFYNAEGAYDNGTAALTPDFAASYAFFLIAMAIVSFMFTICSLRTNVLLLTVFVALTMAFGFLAGAYWHIAKGNLVLAAKLQIGGGALIFALSVIGFVILFEQLLASVDFPYQFPVGDLSTVIKSRTERLKAKKERSHKD